MNVDFVKKYQEFDKLELHLFTCALYECCESYIREINLSDMKTNIQDTNEEINQNSLPKIDRNETCDMSSRFYWRFRNLKLETRNKEN